jgi:hypothetical protein
MRTASITRAMIEAVRTQEGCHPHACRNDNLKSHIDYFSRDLFLSQQEKRQSRNHIEVHVQRS